jgi:hypothetical protein
VTSEGGSVVQAMPLHRVWVLLVAAAIVAVGAWARLESVNASLWLDEFGTLWVIQDGFWAMCARSIEFQGQSPFYYFLAWLSVATLGEAEWVLRLPSLVAGIALVGALYWTGSLVAGRRAGLWAAGGAWLTAPAIVASVDARPYALTLLAAAVACGGFALAVRTGRPLGRALWVIGGASVAWAHYVQFPVVAGLYAGYVIWPAARRQYAVRQFVTDGCVQFALVAMCLPQVMALLHRRDALSWIDTWNPLTFVPPIAALLPTLMLGFVATRRREADPVGDALTRCLWLAGIGHVTAILALALAGLNLLTPRYFLAIVTPALLLCGTTLVRLRAGEAVAALLGFAILTGGGLLSTKLASGSLTGAGFDDWRGAVTELRGRVAGENSPVILYRSGFVEEDAVPLGRPTAATRAPLRSPGQPAFPAAVRPLTFRWSHPDRPEYFANAIAPVIAAAPRFFVLTARWSSSGLPYPEQLSSWIAERWPGRFAETVTKFGGVELMEYRSADGSR